jgi:hypothetical protein
MKFKFLMLCLTTLFIFSCSSDDEGGSESASIVGTWNITSFQTSQSYDLNEDGESSNDLVKELDCFTSMVTFTEAGTFSSTTSNIEFMAQGENDFTIDCDGTTTFSGTYEVDGNTLTTTDEDGTESGAVTITKDKLTTVVQDDDLGQVTLIFERQ